MSLKNSKRFRSSRFTDLSTDDFLMVILIMENDDTVNDAKPSSGDKGRVKLARKYIYIC